MKLFQDNYNFVLWFKMNPICSLLSGATLLKAPCGGFICCLYLNNTQLNQAAYFDWRFMFTTLFVQFCSCLF